MSRNSQGLYTLPLPPVRPAELIESAWANTTMDDIASALTGSLPRDGSAPMVGPLILSNDPITASRQATSKAYVDGFMAFASGLPVGSVVAFAGINIPAGYFECNGQAISRTTYATLFTAIGVTYGSGDGSTTFNVPDMRDEFIRGKSDSRAVGNKQAASFAAHTHTINDPGHVHFASQNSHSHSITTGSHGHTVNDPSHRHDAIVGVNVSGSGIAGGSGVLLEAQTKFASTGISIDAAGNLGGSSDAQQPNVSVANAVTGLTNGATGGEETRPQNIAQIYIIKAENDSSGAPVLTEVDTSDANMIAITDVSPTVVRLDIQSNKPFGIPKLDGSGKVPVSLLPITDNDFLGFFDASGGQNPSEKYPANTYYSGDEYVISDAGTILVYDPITFVASMTAVSVGSSLVYVDGSVTNPDGWYYFVSAGATLASDVSYLPDGGVTATNVQSAITELGNTKVSKAGDTMTGPLVVSVSGTNPALRVTQTGTGDVVRFEDATNPDASPTIIDATGKMIIGGTASVGVGGSPLNLQIQDYANTTNGLMMTRWSPNTSAPYFIFGKSRGANPQTLGRVEANDDVGNIWFSADTGGTFTRRVAEMNVQVDDVSSGDTVAGRMIFKTTPQGGTTAVERLRISGSGAFGLSGANFGSSGQTLISQGSGAPPIWANPQAGRTINANDANPGLLITQTGTGDVVRFEDSANPDSSPFVIDANGRVGIGNTAADVCANLGGGSQSSSTGMFGYRARQTVPITATTLYTGFNSAPVATSAGVYGSVVGFSVNGITAVGGSTVAMQVGYSASSDIIGATNNYGFYGNIPAGTGRWNFYANGTAANFFAGTTHQQGTHLKRYTDSAFDVSTTLTATQCIGGIIHGNPAAGITWTLPSGADLDARFNNLPAADMGFEWSVINRAPTVNTISVATNASGNTFLMGDPVVAANSSARYITKRIGAASWTTYRIA